MNSLIHINNKFRCVIKFLLFLLLLFGLSLSLLFGSFFSLLFSMFFFLFVYISLKFSLFSIKISFGFVVRPFSFIVNFSIDVSNRHQSWFSVMTLALHVFQNYIISGKSLFAFSKLPFSSFKGYVDHHLLKLLFGCKDVCIGVKSNIDNLTRISL